MRVEPTFVEIPGRHYALGNRPDLEGLNPGDREWVEARFSKPRTVTLAPFSIATTTLSAEDLLAELSDDVLDRIENYADIAALLQTELHALGLRLPSSDELEAAFAPNGQVFPWGAARPEGEPWPSKTTFDAHRRPTELGLVPNSNPYRVELTTDAVMFGDGGESLCGGYPWPIPWMSFSPAYRVPIELVEDLLFEFLEESRIRAVRV